MPQVQDYGTQVLPQGGISAQASPQDFGSQIGQADQQVGAAVGDVGQEVNKVAQDQGRIWAYEASSKQYESLKQGFQSQVNSLDPNDPEFTTKTADLTKNFSQQIDQATQDIMNAAPTKSAARIAASHMSMNGRSLLNYSMGEQARITGEYTGKLVNDGLKSDQDSLAADPSNDNYNRVLQNRAGMIGGLTTVDPVAKMKWQDQIEHSMAVTQVQTLAATNPNQFLSTVNAQGGKTNGKGAVPGGAPSSPTATGTETNAGSGSPAASIPDLGADTVKPYTPSRVSSIVDAVNKPSPYDDIFKSEAAKNGIDWRDLKMRAVVESGLNPNAVGPQTPNGQSVGIMQIEKSVAAKAGIDPTNPQQAIAQAATMLGGYAKQSNGDPSGVDKLYYGGTDQKQWGKNTNQYAANLGAVRAAITGGAGTSTTPDTPQVQPLDDSSIASAAPPIAGWGKLTWQEKVNSVRQAEAVVGGQLASDRGKMDQDLRDVSTTLLAGKPFPGIDDSRFSQSNFTRLYGPDQGQRKFDQFNYVKNVGGFMGQMQTMPVAQAQATLKNIEPQGGAEFADKNPVFNAAQEAYARLDKVRQADPMAWAVGNGVAGAKPIDMSNAQHFMDGLHSRIAVANTVSNDYGADSALLSKDEVNKLTDTMSALPPVQQMGYLKAIRLATSGNDTQFQNTIAQIAPKNTTLAQAASASVREGTVTTAGGPQDGDMVGKYILEGAHILQGKDIDDPQHTGRPMALDDKSTRNFFWNAVGPGAFASGDAQRSSQTANDTYQAVKNYLAADVYHRGLDPKAVTQDQVNNAVTAVTGGTVKNNKGDNLFVPWGMDKGQFQQQFPVRAQAAIDAAGYKGTSLDKLDAYHYVNLDDGKYGLTNGGKMLVDKKGRTVTIDFKQPVMPQEAGGSVQ